MSKTESLSLGIEQSTLYSQQECKMSKKNYQKNDNSKFHGLI